MAHTSLRRSATKCVSSYLLEAPSALITLHQQIGQGKDILGRLLTDVSMRPAWRALGKRIKHDRQWRDLWSEITYTLLLVKRDRLELKRQRDTCAKIADAAGKLAKDIEEGPLDLPVFELSFRRSDRALLHLCEWPLVSECLHDLSVKAEQYAHDVLRTVPVKRTRDNRDASIISRRLFAYFVRQLNAPLHDTVATIATVVLSRKVTSAYVETVTRRWKNQKQIARTPS